MGLTDEEANVINTFSEIDENNDGEISKEELFNFIKDQRMLHSEMF